jgi:uncharacterized protein (TIGR03437 family)
MGAVDTPIAPGVAAPYGPLVGMLQSPVVMAGEQPAAVLFAGLTPGSVGLYQIQARLPNQVASAGVLLLGVIAGNAKAEVYLAIQ